MIRAVLDTNVIVSGVLKGSNPPGRLLKALFDGRFQAVTSKDLLGEVARVLAYPKIRHRYAIFPEEAEVVLELLFLSSEQIKLPKASERISRDLHDDLFLLCAVQGEAEYLVSGDKDLLVLENFRGVQIVTPESFLKVIK